MAEDLRNLKPLRLIHPNGLDGRGGGYLLPPLPLERIAALARGRPADAAHAADLRSWARELEAGPRRALQEGADPSRLEESGWGVVFPAGAEAGPLREALAPLLEHRRAQAARRDERLYRELEGDAGYREGDSKLSFLGRHGAGPGPVDPRRMPYYLLLLGEPGQIPFRFQYQLDVQHAVGRLAFETLEEYRAYAEGVVAAETGRITRPRRAVFFATDHPGDVATRLSSRHLARPLAEGVGDDPAGWQAEAVIGEGATRARLRELLGEGEAPALLFTAGHGVGFATGDRRQLAHQGALVCQEWPGPEGGGVCRRHWLAAEDVGAGARPAGLIVFCFACFGAGTPRWDDFARAEHREPCELAPRAFLSRLPQRLLAHPRGGALAVIGHVERAWDFSFLWEGAGRQTEVFASTLRRLLAGHPVGSAMEYFGQRYAELAAARSDEVEALSFGKKADEERLAHLWTAEHDARNYAVLGDPAVRLAVAAGGEEAKQGEAGKLS